MPSPKTVANGQPPSTTTKPRPSAIQKEGSQPKSGSFTKKGSMEGGGSPPKVGSGRVETGEKTRKERRGERAIRDEDDNTPKKILRAEVAKPVVEKKPPPPVEKKEAPPPEPVPEVKVEEKKKRPQPKGRVYRGNMNLIQKVNKEAARNAIRGMRSSSSRNSMKKSSKSVGFSESTTKIKNGPRKRAKKKGLIHQGAWVLFTRKMFGTWTQDPVVLRDEKTKAAASALDFTQADLKRLKMSFDDIDVDGSGTIDIEELFEFLNEKRSPFTGALFALVDLDDCGSIDFEEYLRVLSSYCMYTEEDVLRFCFDCFDKDGSGTIDEEEFIKLCQTVNGATPLFSGNFQKALEAFDINEDGLVDFNEFCALYKKYPMILFPAFRLQDSMQRLTLGHDSWARLMSKIQHQRLLLEYRASHYGKDPPLPFEKYLARLFCPCLHPPVKIHPALLDEYGMGHEKSTSGKGTKP